MYHRLILSPCLLLSLLGGIVWSERIEHELGSWEKRDCPGALSYTTHRHYWLFGRLLGVVALQRESACARLCWSHPLCVGANWDDGRKSCELSSESRQAHPIQFKFVTESPRRNLSLAFLDTFKCEADPALSRLCGRSVTPPRMSPAGFQLGRLSGLPFSGLWEARPHSYPWLLSLQKDRIHHCSAVLISQSHALTAASCFAESKNPDSYRLVLGAHQLDRPPQTVLLLKAIVAHQDYLPPLKRESDLALLLLAAKAAVSSTVQPLCLPESPLPLSSLCLTLGWGSIGQGASKTPWDRLMVSLAPVMPRRLCPDTIHDTELCAGTMDEADRMGPDRGGPLICVNQAQWNLQGIAAFLDSPSIPVYTNISAFAQWIRSHAE